MNQVNPVFPKGRHGSLKGLAIAALSASWLAVTVALVSVQPYQGIRVANEVRAVREIQAASRRYEQAQAAAGIAVLETPADGETELGRSIGSQGNRALRQIVAESARLKAPGVENIAVASEAPATVASR